MIDQNKEIVLEPVRDTQKVLCVEDIDPDAFKRFYEESRHEQEELITQAPSPLNLLQSMLKPLDITENSSIAVQGLSPKAIEGIVEALFNQLSVLIQTVESQGLQETSITLHDPSSLLNNVEIFLSVSESAPLALNIEIKSCDKLQALLHKNQGMLVQQLKDAGVVFTVQRLDFSLHNPLAAKDKIQGCRMKKVTPAGNKSDDNQT